MGNSENILLIGHRLEEYIELTGRSKADFARAIGVNRVTIQRYINGDRLPEADVLLRFWEDGGDINHLFTGMGDMFNSSPSGQERKREVYSKFVKLPYDRPTIANTPQLQRIVGWIVLYFGTLKEFCKYTNTNTMTWQQVFRGETPLEDTMVGILKREGCNLNFISTGQGKPYSDNLAGLFLSHGWLIHDCPKEVYDDVIRSVRTTLAAHDKLSPGVGGRDSGISTIKFGSDFDIREIEKQLTV